MVPLSLSLATKHKIDPLIVQALGKITHMLLWGEFSRPGAVDSRCCCCVGSGPLISDRYLGAVSPVSYGL